LRNKEQEIRLKLHEHDDDDDDDDEVIKCLCNASPYVSTLNIRKCGNPDNDRHK